MIGSIKFPGGSNSPAGIGFNSGASSSGAMLGFRSPYYRGLKVTTTIIEGVIGTESSKAMLSDNPAWPKQSLPVPVQGGIFIICKEFRNDSIGAPTGLLPIVIPTASNSGTAFTGAFSMRVGPSQIVFTLIDKLAIGGQIKIYTFTNNTNFPVYQTDAEHGLLWTWEDSGTNKIFNFYYNGIKIGTATLPNSLFPDFFYDIVFGGTDDREAITGAQAPAYIKIGLAGILNTVITENEARMISSPRFGPYYINDIKSRCQNFWEFNKYVASPGWPTPTAAYTPDIVGTAHLGTGDEIPLNNIYTPY